MTPEQQTARDMQLVEWIAASIAERQKTSKDVVITSLVMLTSQTGLPLPKVAKMTFDGYQRILEGSTMVSPLKILYHISEPAKAPRRKDTKPTFEEDQQRAASLPITTQPIPRVPAQPQHQQPTRANLLRRLYRLVSR